MRLDQIVTLDAMRAMDPHGRYDAVGSAFFVRQLTDIITQTYDVEYPELKARKLIPVDGRFNTGADAFVWRQYDKSGGKAKFVNNYASDFPNVEVSGKEFGGVFKSIGDSYQYSVQDMRAAAMAGVPLDEKKAEAARFGMETTLEDVAATGDASFAAIMPGNGGFLTNTDAMSAVKGGAFTGFPSGSGSAPAVPAAATWASLIAAQTSAAPAAAAILADINFLQLSIHAATGGTYQPDTLVLPTYHYGLLATTAQSPVYTEISILQYILKQSPWLRTIEFWPRLNTAGAGSGPRVACYKKDPKILAMNISQEFEQFPPQIVNLAWKVPCHMRIGAVTLRYPKAVMFLDGC